MFTLRYTLTLWQGKKRKQRMINLLQENIEIKSHRTNSTFGFLPTCLRATHRQAHGKSRKNQKIYFLPTLKRH